ncbi:MAG: hypothetical protein NTU98_11970 [Bacteroidetes bacterium]|nr:hypothetical protein [Bacteroidota bacterium]
MKKTVIHMFGRVLFLAILLLGFTVIHSSAQGILVKSGSTMKVSSGTTVTTNAPTFAGNSITMDYDALNPLVTSTIDNSGTIILKGNLVNNNPGPSNLGSGLFSFTGTSSQTISGKNIFNNMTVNNTSSDGVIIAGNTEVDGTLTLTNGSGTINIGNFDLLMGTGGVFAGGPFDSKTLVVATGSGQLKKKFIDGTGVPRSFTYPVGGNTRAFDYSPVTLSFTTGNFSAGIAGVNLVNSQYTANPSITGDYINRYWNLTNNGGITSFNCNAQFNYISGIYPTGDVTGTETSIYCLRVTPTTYDLFDPANTTSHYLTATGLTSFSTFTGGPGAMPVGLTMFLEGPYNSISHEMNTGLTALPLGDRSDNTKFPQNQPYNGSPWGYGGTESVASLPANVVDWVLVELRHATSATDATSSTVLGRRAGFLLKNGLIVDIDGTTLKFTGLSAFSDKLYPVVYHRNHMAIMATGNGAQKDVGTGVYLYNYSSGSDKMYGGTFGCKQVDTSPVSWATRGGDANADNHIWSNDNDVYVAQYYKSNRYLSADFNMDLHVWSNDNDIYVFNYYKSNLLP